MAECAETFAAELGLALALQVDIEHPNCTCENCALSPHGPVALDEILIRLVLAPQHFDDRKKRPKAAVLSHAESMGLSTFRDRHTTNEELVKIASALLQNAKDKNPKAELKGALMFRADRVKAVPQGDVSPPFCIYDTPSDGTDGHSDVLQRVAQSDEALRLTRRRWLFDELNFQFFTPAEFRGGILLGI